MLATRLTRSVRLVTLAMAAVESSASFGELYAQPIATVVAALIAVGAATIAWRGVRATIKANARNIQLQLDAQDRLEGERVQREIDGQRAALRIEAYAEITRAAFNIGRCSIGYFVIGSLAMTVLNIAFRIAMRPLYRLTEIEIRLARAGMNTEVEALREFMGAALRACPPPPIVAAIGIFPPWSWVCGAYYLYTRPQLDRAADKAAKAVMPVEVSTGFRSAAR